MRTREQYDNSVHKLGRITNIFALIFMLSVPIGTMLITSVYPTSAQLLGVVFPIAVVWFISASAEFFALIPILGSAGSYLAFVTGNISSMKLPASIAAQNSLNLKQGSDEGEVVSTIAIATSSIVTVSVLVLGILGLQLISPVLNHPILKPGFDNVVPALIGAFCAPFIIKNPKKVIIPILFLIFMTFVVYPNVPSDVSKLLQSLMMAIVILVSVIANYITFKIKGE